MAAWMIPAVKAILPFVTPIVTSALPVFTTRISDEAAAAQTDVLHKQITELQSAASQNALHVKDLAKQLQKTLTALEQAAVASHASGAPPCCAVWPSRCRFSPSVFRCSSFFKANADDDLPFKNQRLLEKGSAHNPDAQQSAS